MKSVDLSTQKLNNRKEMTAKNSTQKLNNRKEMRAKKMNPTGKENGKRRQGNLTKISTCCS